jgi:hypothetical protein
MPERKNGTQTLQPINRRRLALAVEQNLLRAVPDGDAEPQHGLADHRLLGVRGLEGGQLDVELRRELGGPGGRGDEAQEGRGRVQRARAELGVRLEADEIRVV